MDEKIQNRYYMHLLLNEISNKHKRLKLLNKQLENETNILNDSKTWKKQKLGRSIHNKKFDSLCKKKQQEDVMKENPSNTIWNLNHKLCQMMNVSATGLEPTAT